jgi:hypothetical protein
MLPEVGNSGWYESAGDRPCRRELEKAALEVPGAPGWACGPPIPSRPSACPLPIVAWACRPVVPEERGVGDACSGDDPDARLTRKGRAAY